jgi:hypothetical protein
MDDERTSSPTPFITIARSTDESGSDPSGFAPYVCSETADSTLEAG